MELGHLYRCVHAACWPLWLLSAYQSRDTTTSEFISAIGGHEGTIQSGAQVLKLLRFETLIPSRQPSQPELGSFTWPLICFATFWTFLLPFHPLQTHSFVTPVSLLLGKMQRSVPSNYCRHYDVLKAIPRAWLITVDSKGHLLLNWLSRGTEKHTATGRLFSLFMFPPGPFLMLMATAGAFQEVAAPQSPPCSAGVSLRRARQGSREETMRLRTRWRTHAGLSRAAMKIFGSHLKEPSVDLVLMIVRSKKKKC